MWSRSEQRNWVFQSYGAEKGIIIMVKSNTLLSRAWLHNSISPSLVCNDYVCTSLTWFWTNQKCCGYQVRSDWANLDDTVGIPVLRPFCPIVESRSWQERLFDRWRPLPAENTCKKFFNRRSIHLWKPSQEYKLNKMRTSNVARRQVEENKFRSVFDGPLSQSERISKCPN